ncbi:MAG: hypothetical protein PHV17_02720 [Candidatus Omnitrophica bacterium]|nr:hypothetical protein [Candidatus Omnitrophota bacterium]
MNNLFLTVLGTFVFFAILFHFLTIVLNKASQRLATANLNDTNPGKRKTTKNVIKSITIGALIVFSIILAIMLRNTDFKSLFHKIGQPDKKKQEDFLCLLQGSNPDYLEKYSLLNETVSTGNSNPIELKDNPRKNKKDLTLLEETFTPNTLGFQDYPSKTTPTNQGIEPTNYPKLNGAEIGDIFVCGLYDTIVEGKFVKSKDLKLELDPQSVKTKTTIIITTQVPSLKENQTAQLPFLINGYVIPEISAKNEYSLSSCGILRILSNDFNDKKISYLLKKTQQPLEITHNKMAGQWLLKEFSCIPKEITEVLNEIRENSESIKLTAVASLLNSYFGYQSGIQKIELAPGKTWNDLLSDCIKNRQRLLSDCDVLSTFAYIYLKHLGFNPILIVGYINSSDYPKILHPQELHATLYLKYQGNWIIFEPTLFTENFQTNITDNGLITEEKQIISQENSENKKELERALSQTQTKYFRLPAKIQKQFKKTAKNKPDIHETRSLVELLISKENQNSMKAQKSLLNTIITMLIYFYLFSIITVKIILTAQKSKKQIVNLSQTPLYLYYLSLIIILAHLLARSYSLPFKFWSTNKIFLKTFPFSVFLVLSFAIVAIFLFLLKRKTSNYIPQSHIALSLCALIYAPSILSFASPALIIYLLSIKRKSL